VASIGGVTGAAIGAAAGSGAGVGAVGCTICAIIACGAKLGWNIVDGVIGSGCPNWALKAVSISGCCIGAAIIGGAGRARPCCWSWAKVSAPPTVPGASICSIWPVARDA